LFKFDCMEKKVILLIDDDDDDKFIFSEVVNDLNLGYECVFASDGIEGLKILKNLKRNPDFIFIDLNMPRMDGKQCLAEIKRQENLKDIPTQCLAEIKRQENLKDIPTIIYTTSKLEGDINETRLLGASYFLTKPSLFTHLNKAIFNVLTNLKELQNAANAEAVNA
jgi:CheY-like chemotaxis protein